MSLSLVLDKVVEFTGRADLTSTKNISNTVRWINSAQTLLDDEVWNFKKSEAVKVITLYAGMYFVTFTYARSISKVWVSNSDGLGKIDIETYSLDSLREKYGEDPNNTVSHDGTVAISVGGVVTGTSTTVSDDGVVAGDIMVLPNVSGGLWLLVGTVTSNISWTVTNIDGSAYSGGAQTGQYFYVMNQNADRGTPEYGAFNIIRLAPGTAQPLPIYDTADLVTNTGGAYARDGMLLYPPPDGEYTLRLQGFFYSDPLSSADLTTCTYWTEIHDGLILALKTVELLELVYADFTTTAGYANKLDELVRGLKAGYISQRKVTVGRRQKMGGH